MRTHLIKTILAVFILTFVQNTQVQACDTSPTLLAENVTDIGGGFFTVDITVCIGLGSDDGFDVTMGCGLNITATSVASFSDNKVVNASITGGVLSYDCSTCNAAQANKWFVMDDGTRPCFSFTITVDGNPEGCDVSFTGVNDGCSNTFSGGVFTTTIPAPCIVNYTLNGSGTLTGNTSGASNGCAKRGSEDQVIEVIIPCDGSYTFSTCGTSWDTYLYLLDGCCGNTIASDDDSPCGTDSEIIINMTTGTYYILVEAYSTGTSGSYEFSMTGPGCALSNPIFDFNGDCIGNYETMISWSAEADKNRASYTIEQTENINHSTIDWNSAGIINDSISFSNSNSYNFILKNTTHSNYYYRIKETDNLGLISYSDIINLDCKDKSLIENIDLIPNPTNDYFQFHLEGLKLSETLEVQIFSSAGKLVTHETFTANSKQTFGVELNNFEQGMYFVHIQKGSLSTVKKLLILD